MKTVLVRIVTSSFMLLSLGMSPAVAQSAPALDVPPIPDNLQIPAGNTLFLGTRAAGTQNYVCLPIARRTVGWRFLAAPGSTAVPFYKGLEEKTIGGGPHAS